MFVGAGRTAEVGRLLECFDQVRTTSASTLVTYAAPPGWGKTRIVQEFYARLATAQDKPWYWPPSLVNEPASGAGTSGDLAATRKTIRPAHLQVPPDLLPPWLWLGLPSVRLGDGSVVPAGPQLATQLVPHLPPLVLKLERSGSPLQEVYRAIAAVLSPSDVRALATTAPALSAEIVPAGQVRGTADVATGLATLLRLLQLPLPRAERTPTIVVLDDAHDLDQSAVNLIAELRGTELPVLFVATTWPEHLGATANGAPFAGYLQEAASTERATLVQLDRLSTEELVEFVLHQFPDTDPIVATRLAERADGNPYALRLLLDTALVRSACSNHRIDLQLTEIDQLNGGLEDLLRQHWMRLSVGVQQTLVTTALLGESVLDEVLVAALGAVRPKDGLDAALATAWIRVADEQARIVEFIERIRYDVARGAAPNVLPTQARTNVLASALRAVRHLLHDDTSEARHVLLALHVGLAKVGVELDLVAAGHSAAELAELAREQHRRLEAIKYLEQAVAWMEASGTVDRRTLVRRRLELVSAVRIEHTRQQSEPYADTAYELAEQLDEQDELRILARLGLARALLRGSDRERFARAYELLHEAERLTDVLDAPSPEVIRDLWSFQASAAGRKGQHAGAAQRCKELVAHCEQHYGPNHRYTLSAMEDLAFNAMRSHDLDTAVAIRREILRRRIDRMAVAGYIPTAPARNNLAAALVRVGTPATLDEAEQLALEAKNIWSRVYGIAGLRTQRSRMVLARICQCRGLLLERAGEPEGAKALFNQALAETAELCKLRQKRDLVTQPLALMRHGISQACLYDDEAITSLSETLRLREVELQQDRDHWDVQETAHHLAWAYDRFKRPREAAGTRRLYHLP